MQTYAKNEQTMQNNPSLRGVVMAKIVGHVQKHKARQLFGQAVELAGGVFLGSLLVAPEQILAGVEFVVKMENYAFPKVLVFGLAFFGRKTIKRFVLRARVFFQKKEAAKHEEKLLDGVPVPELVDYMLRNKQFKREGINGVRATFGLNMDKFNRLAKKLEENKVLVRGENNGRILDGHWSRQALIDYLSGYEKSAAIQPRFKIHRIGSGAKVRLDRHELASV